MSKQKITFKNSLLEYLVAVILYKPLEFVIASLLFLILQPHEPDTVSMVSNVSSILSAVTLFSIATKLVYRKLAREEGGQRYKKVENNISTVEKGFCSSCGSPIKSDDKFCTKCGNKTIS